ncbi:hypothetical protein AAC03nite_13730 [Alicyclobacillus acidoterrestris]|nr:hypothetical protein AAC03nite_13730 [Alicyclobacillus acidoterrestris]
MEQDLMSKKELLELTGISYGQLYRWKRKKLIPEEWFIRKSTFTGQETFFPRERMLQRIAQIQSMKDDLSLDEMARMFSPGPSDISLSPEQLLAQNIVTKSALDVLFEQHPGVEILKFEQLLSLYVVDVALRTGDIHLDDAAMMFKTMEQNVERLENVSCRLLVIRKLGVSSCFLCSTAGDLYFDADTKIVMELDLAKCIEELKLRFM